MSLYGAYWHPPLEITQGIEIMLKNSLNILLIATVLSACSVYANNDMPFFSCDSHTIDMDSTKAAVKKYCGEPDEIENSIGSQSVASGTDVTSGTINHTKSNTSANDTFSVFGGKDAESLQSKTTSEEYPIQTWVYLKDGTTEIITFVNGKIQNIDSRLG